eukprot:TRINITY_DN28666_c0_g1_i4.p2 TRINITY_DN28666_c0_g1~~TRINITY_DN28666_c0_g1_i4.p2  ORF type:complete len:153 (+),score=34.52 TRINITY_DN28666_c0_g1_i4:36-494(+)
MFFFLMIRRPPRSTQGVSSAASDVYKRQVSTQSTWALLFAHYNTSRLLRRLDNAIYSKELDLKIPQYCALVEIEVLRETEKIHNLNHDEGEEYKRTECHLWSESSEPPRQLDDVCARGTLRVTAEKVLPDTCLLYTSPSPRDLSTSRMPSSA